MSNFKKRTKGHPECIATSISSERGARVLGTQQAEDGRTGGHEQQRLRTQGLPQQLNASQYQNSLKIFFTDPSGQVVGSEQEEHDVLTGSLGGVNKPS